MNDIEFLESLKYCNLKPITGDITGSLTDSKTNYWYGVINIYPNGKRKQKWIKSNITHNNNKRNKRKAESWLRNLLTEINKTPTIITGAVSVAEYFKYWLKVIEKEVEPNTYRSYKGNMLNHIIPYFEKRKVKLQDLKYYHLEEYYKFKVNGYERLDGKEGKLSPQTIKHHHQNISKALNDAVKRELILVNPATLANTPKVPRHRGTFYNQEEIKEMLSLFVNTKIKVPVFLTSFYGLRRSEVIGLQWKNVDFINKRLTIAHTTLQNTGGDYERDNTKTDSSYRSFPMNETVIQVLQEEKKRQEQQKELLGNYYKNSDKVCVLSDGTPITCNYLSKNFNKVIKNSNLPYIKLHELRHSCASNLLSMGFSVVQVAEWLGHSSPSTTLNFYAHIDSNSKKDMANSIGNFVKL